LIIKYLLNNILFQGGPGSIFPAPSFNYYKHQFNSVAWEPNILIIILNVQITLKKYEELFIYFLPELW